MCKDPGLWVIVMLTTWNIGSALGKYHVYSQIQLKFDLEITTSKFPKLQVHTILNNLYNAIYHRTGVPQPQYNIHITYKDIHIVLDFACIQFLHILVYNSLNFEMRSERRFLLGIAIKHIECFVEKWLKGIPYLCKKLHFDCKFCAESC